MIETDSIFWESTQKYLREVEEAKKKKPQEKVIFPPPDFSKPYVKGEDLPPEVKE